ncbi:MAG: hypothetical protein AAFW75_33590 [Cyanobacteria bacterium J06636_16]
MLRSTATISLTLLSLLFTSATVKATELFEPFFFYSFSDNLDETTGTIISPFDQIGFTALALEDFANGGADIPGVSISIDESVIGAELDDISDFLSFDPELGIEGPDLSGFRSVLTATVDFSADELGGQVPTTTGLFWTQSESVGGGTPLYTGNSPYYTLYEEYGASGEYAGGVGTEVSEVFEGEEASSIFAPEPEIGGIASVDLSILTPSGDASESLSEPLLARSEPIFESSSEPVSVPEPSIAALFSVLLAGFICRRLSCVQEHYLEHSKSGAF